ncbi:MAG: hypothetical protein J7L21_01920, partial [Sulfurimonas sp.]|nr:hypothetical protein [Sulfurimonas sp.]
MYVENLRAKNFLDKIISYGKNAPSSINTRRKAINYYIANYFNFWEAEKEETSTKKYSISYLLGRGGSCTSITKTEYLYAMSIK